MGSLVIQQNIVWFTHWRKLCVFIAFLLIGPLPEAFINYATYIAVFWSWICFVNILAVYCHLGVECGYHAVEASEVLLMETDWGSVLSSSSWSVTAWPQIIVLPKPNGNIGCRCKAFFCWNRCINVDSLHYRMFPKYRIVIRRWCLGTLYSISCPLCVCCVVWERNGTLTVCCTSLK